MSKKPSYEELEIRINELEQVKSERDKTLKVLQEREKRFQEAQQLAHMGNWFWDVNSGEVEWSIEVYNIFRLDPKEFTPQIDSILELSPWPEENLRDKELIQKTVENREVGSYEQRFLRPDGSIGYYFSSFQGVYDDNGKLTAINGVVHDITERKQVEFELQAAEQLFSYYMDNIDSYVYIKDREGNYTFINKKTEKLFNTTRKDLKKKKYTDFDFFDEEMAKQLRENDRKIIDIGQNTENEEIGRPEGRENIERGAGFKYFLALKFPLRDKDGNIIGVCGFSHDITKQKIAEENKIQLETQLKQAQKMESIGILAGGIAHDFNNILYPIIGFTELAIQDLPKTHQVQENLQDILDGAKRARDLVKQILQFSRQKKQTLQPTILQPVIKEVIKLLKTTIPANIDIQTHLYNKEDYVLCDASEIHEIVMNLCTNAYHSVEENGGTIIVRLNQQNPSTDLKLPSGEYICLSVSDNGVGIPQEIIDKIFEPYFTSKEIGKGSGLGLSVVHGIVTNYKGDISVESRLGKGSVFNVFLPLTTQSEKVDDTQIVDTPLKGTENILFVDDETSIVKLATRILEQRGYTITGKTSCIEALELFKDKPDKFDLVITDMAMPIMTGTEFSKKILKTRPDIPIIICTGFSESVDPEIAASIGIKGYIKKPILIEELTSKIREILNQSSKG